MVSAPRVLLVLLYVVVGVLYESLVWFASSAITPRFPTPYAVPIFDVPFALVAVGIGYLCLERHRLRQDARSAGMGATLWLTALLALSHVLAQPDYPANPGVNAGIAPYFFFLSYFAGLVGIGLAAHCGERSFRLTGRGRLAIAVGIVALSGGLMTAVLHVRPLLPPVAGGRFTPFGLGAGYFVVGSCSGEGSFNVVRTLPYVTTSVVEFPSISTLDYESSFRSAAMPLLFIPLHGSLPEWLSSPHQLRGGTSGAPYDKMETLPQKLDAIIYIDRTTPSSSFW